MSRSAASSTGDAPTIRREEESPYQGPFLGAAVPITEATDFKFWGYPERHAWSHRALPKIRARLAHRLRLNTGRIAGVTLPWED